MLLKTSKWIFVCFILLSCFQACKEKSNIQEIAEEFDPRKLPEKIELSLKALRNDTNFTHYFDTLSVVYASREFKPIWLEKFRDSLYVTKLQLIADSIAYDGLRPEHYMTDSIFLYINHILKGKGDIYLNCAKAELYLSNFMVGLWHDKVMGRTNPKEVLGMKYTLPYPNHPEFKPLVVLNPDSCVELMISYHPNHSDYWKLKKLLTDSYGITEGSETFIDTSGIRKLVKGDSTNIVPLLAKRLVELGFAPDSVMTEYENQTIYDKTLANYVADFQRHSNLTDDGIIGKSTLKILNASRNDKIDEIRANMERLRWFGIEPPKPYVRVNIPEFVLYMHYQDSVKSMLVCVGKGKERYYDQKLKKYVVSKHYFDKPMNHETPQVYSNIDFVILNPTWTVPSSIVGREMYNLIVRNPGYLIKNNYQVLKNGQVIDPYSINWRKLKPGNIPYTIRQNAGDDNSLGKIKFTFRNPFDVYLHDTPLKSKFKLNNRAVSHGCVRVQGPVDLTGFVLQQNVKNTYDDVLIMMGMAPKDTARARKWAEDTTSYKKIVKKTYPIRVENKMTVFFDYRTVVFDEMGKSRFLFDVYDKNSLIIEALNRQKKAPQIL